MKNTYKISFLLICIILLSTKIFYHSSEVSTAFATLSYESITNLTNTPQKVTAKATSNSKSKIKKNTTKKSVKKKLIVIDAGHQSKGNNQVEPIGPGAKTTKPKVSSGTCGVASGVPEYQLTLTIAKKVQKELISRGYEVIMIRSTNDINLSNKERADIANKSGADIFIRIHADSINSPNVVGASTLYPSKKNPYVSKLSTSSYALSKAVINSFCMKTGAKNRGAIARDDMSGINWCKVPVTILEMGFMSNKKEDMLLQNKNYQTKMTEGICDGIDQYFASKK